MKKQIWLGIIILVMILLFWPLRVGADEKGSGLDLSKLDFDGVDEMLKETGADETLQTQTKAKTVGELLEEVMEGEIKTSWKDWLAAFGSSLWGNLQPYMGLMIQVIGLALVSQFFNSLTIHFGEGSAGDVGFLCVYSVMVLVLVESFQIAYEETKQTVEQVRNLSLYMMPAMAAVAVAGGFPISSIVQGEALSGGFSLLLTLIKNIFTAGILWITILEMVNFISKRAMLTQLTSLGRTILEKGMKGICALYLAVMGIMGTVMPAADRMVYKVSNTLLSSVPVVGSAMSGAMESVMAGSVLGKNGIGAAGCIILLCICLLPVAKLTAFWLMYRLISAFMSPIADERVVQLLSALGRSTAMLLGIMVSSMVIFTGAVGILVVTLRQ